MKGIIAAVTYSGPTLHPQGHMNWWYASPFTTIEPHLFTAIILLIPVAGIVFYRRGKKKAMEQEVKWEQDDTEKRFQELMNRKKVIMNKLLELEEARDKGELPEEEWQKKSESYKNHLYKVKRELNDLIDKQ